MTDERLARLEALCRSKDRLIDSLHEDLQLQRKQREESAHFVESKAAKIKNWVTSRLKELEQQNEKLRAQNAKCARQLELLHTCSERTAGWRSSLLSNSLVTALEAGGMPAPPPPRSSGDSGTTSDAPPDYGTLEWPQVCSQARMASYEQIMCCSTNSIRTDRRLYPSILPLRERNKDLLGVQPRSNPGSPRFFRHSRAKLKAQLAATSTARTHSLPRDSVYERQLGKQREATGSLGRAARKPVPAPRKKTVQPAPEPLVPRAFLVDADTLCVERDSLDVGSVAGQPTDSMCNLIERDSLNADYVNIADVQLAAANWRRRNGASSPPPPPPAQHRMNTWEKKLHDLARQCLANASELSARESITSVGATSPRGAAEQRNSSRTTSSDSQKIHKDSTCSGSSTKLPLFTTRRPKSPRARGAPSTSSSGGVSPRPKTAADEMHAYRSGASSRRRAADESDSDGDYAYPPDAFDDGDEHYTLVDANAMHTSVVACSSQAEKSGYLMSISESRIKSLKRRWCVLRYGELCIFRSQKEDSRNEQPITRLAVNDIITVDLVAGKNSTGFLVTTASGSFRFSAESDTTTQEWIRVLRRALKSSSVNYNGELADGDCLIKGWVTKVKLGHSKRCYAAVKSDSIVFFKTSTMKVPSSQMQLKGAHVATVVGASDESASDDAAASPQRHAADAHEYSVCVQQASTQPVYLVFASQEENEKWLYYLKLATKGGQLYGTPLEVLIGRLMVGDGCPDNPLWNDLLLITAEESPKEALLTLSDKCTTKSAVELAKACYLFATVGMRASALEYHVDLAQSTLGQALADDHLRNELFAQLVRLTNGAVALSLQAWKLLALAVSLAPPSHYTVLWLLRKHLDRWACMGGDEASMAQYCQQALRRCEQKGARKERPSKLEAASVLARNPCAHALPHSVPVQMPDGAFRVVGLDGSTTAADCVEQLCALADVRAPLLSGYALYHDDPLQADSLAVASPRAKVCDLISRWEQNLAESKHGRVPSGKTVKFLLQKRYHWSHLAMAETAQERLYMAYEMAEEVRAARVPVSPELAQELCALFAQMHYGDYTASDAQQLDVVIGRFYPDRLLQVACAATLRAKMAEQWGDLRASSAMDCARVALGVLRRWPLFGARSFAACMRWRNDERVRLAVDDRGVHLLAANTLDTLASYPFAALVSFGGYSDDFMLTVAREVDGRRADEPRRERLTFAMRAADIRQLSLLVADYMKARRRLSRVADERRAPPPVVTPRRTPRRSPQHRPV